MNKQEIFDKAVSGVIAQGGPSIGGAGLGDSTQCVYRASNGRKCALGQLIDDAEYSPNFEGAGVYTLANTERMARPGREYALPSILKDRDNYAIIWALQQAHDNGSNALGDAFLPVFKERVRGVAHDFGLSTAVID